MYKCVECGYLFEEPADELEPHGEVHTGCPVCGGTYEITMQCQECGYDLLQEELHSGICLHCIRKSLTNTKVAAYAAQRDKETGPQEYPIEQSLYEQYFDCDIQRCSPAIMELMRRAFLAEADDLDFLEDWVMGDEDNLDDYANWLQEHQKCMPTVMAEGA